MELERKFILFDHFPEKAPPLPIGVRFVVEEETLEKVEFVPGSSRWEAVQYRGDTETLIAFCHRFLIPWCHAWSVRKAFALPLHEGNVEKKLEQGLHGVLPGMTISYAELGERLSVHPRAAGRLLSQNRLPLVIPCHRVICTDGSIGGYAFGVELKKKLLTFEASMN